MKKFLTIFLLCMAFISQYSQYLRYVECKFITSQNNCDCTQFLAVAEFQENDPAIPVKHAHHIIEEVFYFIPHTSGINSEFLSLTRCFPTCRQVALPKGELVEIDQPPDQAAV